MKDKVMLDTNIWVYLYAKNPTVLGSTAFHPTYFSTIAS
jgi:predicted nucleic acid-binding protein